LHACSHRRERPFIELRCDHRSDQGAGSRPVSITTLKTAFVRARGGTLFLDEVAALDTICQTWLCSHLFRRSSRARFA
jgi:DNA-binding NtrC family response regulator